MEQPYEKVTIRMEGQQNVQLDPAKDVRKNNLGWQKNWIRYKKDQKSDVAPW